MMILPFLLAFSVPTCVSVDTDKVLAGHLVAAVPAFAALPPESAIGYAPLPGTKRMFSVDELRRTLAAHGATGTIDQPACIEWKTATLGHEQALGAMQSALGEGRIEILELSKHLVPAGQLVFTREALPTQAGTDGSAIWKGHVIFAGTRRLEVWARVRVWIKQTRVVAKTAIRSGETVSAEQLKLEETEGFPLSEDIASAIAEVEGQAARASLTIGTAIRRSLLTQPNAITKGDVVEVEVRVGATHLSLKAKAGMGGGVGSMIPVQNVDSGKMFTARVAAKGKVVVER
jgi:flagella basal body P-ring formation protein FlgA